MKTEKDAQSDKRYEKIVAETKCLIEETTDPASKAQLERALREGESFNRLVDEQRSAYTRDSRAADAVKTCECER